MFHGLKKSKNHEKQVKNMAHRSFWDNWSSILGEVNIAYQNRYYLLRVGYSLSVPHQLYARLYDHDENFIGGSFIHQIGQSDASLTEEDPNLQAIIIEQAKRIEKLGAFA